MGEGIARTPSHVTMEINDERRRKETKAKQPHSCFNLRGWGGGERKHFACNSSNL